jgi:hypothetical protein
VNRGVIFAAVALVALIIAAVFMVSIFRTEPREAAAPVTAPAAAPAAPGPPPPAPAPVPDTAPRTARRAAPEAPAAEAPTPATPEPVVEAPPDVATLRIVTDVPNAQVFIDRQFIGAAPTTAENVKPGSHQINVSAEGFDSFVDTITVEPGPRDISIRFREVRLNAAIDVVHKHRIGSCKGRLVATPQGLRYETADKDDAFTAPLAGLEVFQVDYLEKNLKVKLPKGRQFNFTDPEGNADKLFVFQRDVEKARERLKKGDAPAP